MQEDTTFLGAFTKRPQKKDMVRQRKSRRSESVLVDGEKPRCRRIEAAATAGKFRRLALPSRGPASGADTCIH